MMMIIILVGIPLLFEVVHRSGFENVADVVGDIGAFCLWAFVKVIQFTCLDLVHPLITYSFMGVPYALFSINPRNTYKRSLWFKWMGQLETVVVPCFFRVAAMVFQMIYSPCSPINQEKRRVKQRKALKLLVVLKQHSQKGVRLLSHHCIRPLYYKFGVRFIKKVNRLFLFGLTSIKNLFKKKWF